MNYANAKLASLTPAAPGWHAVFVNDDGEPELEPIACWGLYEIDDENAVLAMTRSAGNASRLVPADLDPTYVGIAAPGEDEDDWADACREHHADLGGEGGEGDEGDEEADGDDDEDEDVDDGRRAGRAAPRFDAE
ncbi:MAG TPA: hypothetical protein VFS43_46000 [Polyangiaceae bacterium]|nr:hypothetical protein [Polyangiaceae bacterium]